MTPPVVVAVVSWNTRDLLAECLRSLEPVVRDGLAEAWVVDNASSDGSAELVARDFGWARLLASGENLGFGRAVNEVARRTESEWLAPANADVRLHSRTLAALLEAAESHAEAAILAPRLVGPDGRVQQSVHAFPGVGLAAALALGLPVLSRRLGDRLCIDGRWDPARARLVDWAHGAFLLCRRSVFDAVGGFDERQWLYAEDLDLAWRISRRRGTVRYVPGAEVAHVGRASTTQAFGDRVDERFMTATLAWMRERRGRVAAALYACVNLFGAAARWVGFGLAALFVRRHASRRDAARRWMGVHARALRPGSATLVRR